MARSNILVLLGVGLSVSACGPVSRNAPPPNFGLASVNQPVVQRTDYVLDLDTSGGGVAGSELDRLDQWFQSLQLGYGDRVAIDDGYAGSVSRQAIAEVAAGYGMLLSDGAPVTAGAVQPGSVRVIVSRTTASVPGCPNWDSGKFGALASTSSNFGCATNSNLARMIADPNDLVLGRTGNGSGDAATASKAIKQYRDAAPTGAQGLDKISTSGDK